MLATSPLEAQDAGTSADQITVDAQDASNTDTTDTPQEDESQNTSPPAAEEAEASETDEGETVVASSDTPSRLRFLFDGARWREVLDWLAEQGGLALHVGDLPTGTFTYSDDRSYTVNEAISRLNMFLIPEGYVAVRRGQLLTVITLGDQRSLQQLDSMAEVVTLDALADLDRHEVVKTFVPLGDISAEDAINELRPLSLMLAPVHLPQSNQLMLTETAGKLRNAVNVLSAMEEPDEESVVRRFDLEHVTAETVLLVAGGHLGIPQDETSGIDITITTDLTGKQLYAIGNPAKVNKLEQLLEVIDVTEENGETRQASTLVSHAVSEGNLQAVYDVLQTLLAGEDIRLSMQEATNSIVAYAPAGVHEQIKETISELRAPEVEFAVIDLQGTDPYFAVTLIAEMFGTEDSDSSSDYRYWRRDRDREESSDKKTSPPKVDADPDKNRLFVRGTATQIAQIRELVAEIGGEGQSTAGTRLVPLQGDLRFEAMRAAKEWWQQRGELEIIPPFERSSDVIERTVHEEPEHSESSSRPAAAKSHDDESNRERGTDFTGLTPRETDAPSTASPKTEAHFTLASNVGRDATPQIRSQVVPEGIVIQSEDPRALDQFESFLRTLADEQQQAISPPVIYYLKYVTAEEAVNMLADLLDGAEMLAEQSTGSLVRGGATGAQNGYFGSLLYERDGVTTMTAGTATIVSDGRLNRLVVQGTAEEIAMIDRYMKIIDKESSITDVETSGQTHVIELVHAKAEEVAEIIRGAFPDRVAEPQSSNGRQQRRGEGNARDDARRGDDNDRRDRDGQRQAAIEKPTRGQQPTMAVAVHEASNAVVITAPAPLFEDVQQLVESIDRGSEEVVEVVAPRSGVNMEMIMQALGQQEGVSFEEPERRSDNRRTGRDRDRD